VESSLHSSLHTKKTTVRIQDGHQRLRVGLRATSLRHAVGIIPTTGFLVGWTLAASWCTASWCRLPIVLTHLVRWITLFRERDAVTTIDTVTSIVARQIYSHVVAWFGSRYIDASLAALVLTETADAAAGRAMVERPAAVGSFGICIAVLRSVRFWVVAWVRGADMVVSKILEAVSTLCTAPPIIGCLVFSVAVARSRGMVWGQFTHPIDTI